MGSILPPISPTVFATLTKPDIQGWLVVADPNKIYLPKDGTRTYDRIQFTYIHDNFTEGKAANYSSTAVLGRSEPIRGYLGSTPRTLNLELMVPIEGDALPAMGASLVTTTVTPVATPAGIVQLPLQNQTTSEPTMTTVFRRKLEVMDFIRALVYPHYTQQSNQVVYPPPRVLVILGDWFSMLGIVTNYSMTHRAPWAGQGLMAPYYTDVALSIEECDQPYSFQDVYSGSLRLGGKLDSKIPSQSLTSRIG